MREMLAMNPDVVKVQVLDARAQVVFDSAEIQDVARSAPPAHPTVVPPTPERLAAVRQTGDTILHGRNAEGEETLEIVSPYTEGGEPLYIDYQVSYRRLRSEIQHLVWATGGLTLISIALSLIVAVALATRITKPLSELTEGAKEIAQGHFDRRL